MGGVMPMDAKKGNGALADWLREGITSYQSFPTAFRHFASTLTERSFS
jgi:hypothetical protein